MKATFSRVVFSYRTVSTLINDTGRSPRCLSTQFPHILEKTSTRASAPHSIDPMERWNKKIRRRTNVVGIFPYRYSVVRLAGAELAEQHEDWIQQRRYMQLGALKDTAVILSKSASDAVDADLSASFKAAIVVEEPVAASQLISTESD